MNTNPGLKPILLMASLVLLAVGCAERERLNPFDPAASTSQSPFNLRLQSYSNSVILRWSPISSPDLTGYNVFRARIGDSLQQIGQLPRDEEEFVDPDITLYEEYVYAVSALGDENESPLSRLDTITPGRSRWWALSSDFAPVNRLAHDGLHLNASISASYLSQEIVVPVNQSTVYIYDRLGGRLFRQPVGAEPIQVLENIGYIRKMVYTPVGNQLVALYGGERRDIVGFIDLATHTVDQVNFDAEVNSITVDSQGRIWTSTSSTIFRVLPQTKTVDRRLLMDIDSSVTALENGPDDRPYFVTSAHNMVYKINGNDSAEPVVATEGARRLRYDPQRGLLWILAYNTESQRYSLQQFTGTQLNQVLGGLNHVYSFDINPVSGTCLVPDFETETVHTVTPEGERRSRRGVAGRIYYVVAQSLGG